VETINLCNIKLLFRFTNRVDKDFRTSKTARDNSLDELDSDTSKDIKKGMNKFEAKIKAGGAQQATQQGLTNKHNGN
jgi:hypothetical protein